MNASCLALFGGPPTIASDEARFKWPRITDRIRRAVLAQLEDTLSIYDDSGVFGEFEHEFASYHGRRHALLFNSGTSAILAMYEAIGLCPGDEVLCPVYTFHATVSPLMYIGVTPVFCDADAEGNISVDDIRRRTTSRTRAVVVTHMWGRGASGIEEIADHCRERGIRLLEDCSHAHGARVNDRVVGSFGDLAAWSLQGPKTVSGGEGGILAADDQTMYERALLHGHYNHRAARGIDPGSPLRQFALTGMGLKLRAHPLAIVVALEQLRELDAHLGGRAAYADAVTIGIDDCAFLQPPSVRPPGHVDSWYAYVFLFDESKAYGVSRERFLQALLAEGLCEMDVPGSTGVLNNQRLFTHPHELLARLYRQPLPIQRGFPQAQEFENSMIKMPMWAFPDEQSIVEAYVDGINKVVRYVETHRGL